MPSFGNLLGSFTGSAQQRYTDRAHQQATSHLNQGQQGTEGALREGYDSATGYLNPYAQQGQSANRLYGNALGLNGADARQQFMSQYATGDPFRQFNEDNASRALARRYAAMGYRPGGGTAGLGLARAQLERGSQDYESYLNRLGGAAGQGAGIAGQQAQLATGYGQGLAGSRAGFAQQHAANAINYGNASAANSNIFMNNLMGLGSLAVSAATGMPMSRPGGNTAGGNAAGRNTTVPIGTTSDPGGGNYFGNLFGGMFGGNS